MRASILAFIREAKSIKPLKYIHSFLVISGLIRDRLIVAQLAKSLAFSDNLPLAYALLDQVPPRRRTPFLLNSLLSDFAAYPRMPKLAFSLYKRLVHGTGGFAPDEYTFPVLLKSCSRSSGLEEGRQVHGVVVRLGHLSDIYVQNGLVHLYAACCLFVDARALFDEMLYRDVVSWTGLISGYVKGGSLQSALQLFCEMDVTPNDATLVSVLVACGKLNDLTVGRGVHGLILKRGVEEGLVISNALLDMYVKCGSIHEAKVVFWSLQHRDIVSWTSIITGLVHCRRAEEALEVFCHMRAYRVVPDKLTLASVLSACASSGQLDLGGWVHEYIDRNGIEWDVHLGTALVDMYAKGGCVEKALEVFHRMPSKNLKSWNALLGGLAMHGHGTEVLAWYDRLISSGLAPNDVTFIAVLSACSHCGLVEEGRHHFSSMTGVYDIRPRIEHFGCMVDLLSRAGLLQEAFDLIKSMPLEADELIWGAMLSACRDQGSIELLDQIKGYILDMDWPPDSGVYVLLSNIYASCTKWSEVTQTRRLMTQMGIRKEPGSSTTMQVDNKVTEFSVVGV